MFQKIECLSVTAGKFKDTASGELLTFASGEFLSNVIHKIISDDEIKVGVPHMKMKIETADNNAISYAIANSGLLPGIIVLDVEMREMKVKGIAVSTNFVCGFDLAESQKLRKQG